MKIYTLTGDDGTTSLSGGGRVPKHSARVEAYGSVDELIAWIGLLRDLKENSDRTEILIYIQDQLMRCASVLASIDPGQNKKLILPDAECLSRLESEIDRMEEKLPPLNSFILPGGNISVSYCHVARCVCRRAERAVTRLKESEESPDIITKFLNRLSDFLFVLAKLIGYQTGYQEVKWPLV
ncbi:MAG TPA: cob(I)yrinic acid a,c-diamide adenosyltransferase [Bacteroidales bacterium]|nr:cob(I)yrinic acid a,c-diamide adenosyltransferase [Bacteroidales bacterium]